MSHDSLILITESSNRNLEIQLISASLPSELLIIIENMIESGIRNFFWGHMKIEEYYTANFHTIR